MEALKRGAANYVPKQRLADDLLSTVAIVLALACETQGKARLLESLVESRFRFVLPSEEKLIPELVEFLQDRICCQDPDCDKNLLMQVGIALQEAIRDAMHHGNLEVSSELRQDSVAVYDAKVEERLGDPVYSSRRVTVEAVFERQSLRCVVQDEGPGFDPASVPDPTDPENLLRTSGRGIYLISTFMDSIEFNDSGTQVVITKDLSCRETD